VDGALVGAGSPWPPPPQHPSPCNIHLHGALVAVGSLWPQTIGHPSKALLNIFSYRSTLATLTFIMFFSRNVKVSIQNSNLFVNQIEESVRIF
jgi:hypothetical protein